jgi:hypothetical protein
MLPPLDWRGDSEKQRAMPSIISLFFLLKASILIVFSNRHSVSSIGIGP